MPATLHREKYPAAYRSVRLESRRELAPGLLRLRLQTEAPDGLAGFHAPGAGDHTRVFVGTPDGAWSVPLDQEGLPVGDFRVETVVDHSTPRGWIDIDVLVHRDSAGAPVGLIGPWAEGAPLGSPAVVADPKGSVIMTGRPREWLLAGDDSAIPAIRRYLALLAGSGSGTVLLETLHDPEALELEVPGDVELSILAPEAERPSGALVDAITLLREPRAPIEGEFFVFACGEQSLVAPVRAQLARWGIDVEQAVVKGYWRRN